MAFATTSVIIHLPFERPFSSFFLYLKQATLTIFLFNFGKRPARKTPLFHPSQNQRPPEDAPFIANEQQAASGGLMACALNRLFALGKGGFLQLAQLGDAVLCHVQQGIQFTAAEKMTFGRALNFNNLACFAHDDVHIAVAI